jgi:hypothetical protein
MYTSRSLTAVARELARYKLGLMSVQEVRRKKGETLSQGIAHFSLEEETKNHHLRKRSFVHHRTG